MYYYLSSLSTDWGPLRLFNYITFRAGGAFITAFLIVLLSIPVFLPYFRVHCVHPE